MLSPTIKADNRNFISPPICTLHAPRHLFYPLQIGVLLYRQRESGRKNLQFWNVYTSSRLSWVRGIDAGILRPADQAGGAIEDKQNPPPYLPVCRSDETRMCSQGRGVGVLELFKTKVGRVGPYQIGKPNLSHQSKLPAHMPAGADCGCLP